MTDREWTPIESHGRNGATNAHVRGSILRSAIPTTTKMSSRPDDDMPDIESWQAVPGGTIRHVATLDALAATPPHSHIFVSGRR